MKFMKQTIPFGKHKGKPLKDIPSSYLLWIAENFDSRHFVKLAKNELDRRGEAEMEQMTQDFLNRATKNRVGKHPIPDDVVLNPVEECPFDDGMSDIDREYRGIVGQ